MHYTSPNNSRTMLCCNCEPHCTSTFLRRVQSNSPPTLTGAMPPTVSTIKGCNQWLSLAKTLLKVALVGGNCSLVARTSKCEWAIRCKILQQCHEIHAYDVECHRHNTWVWRLLVVLLFALFLEMRWKGLLEKCGNAFRAFLFVFSLVSKLRGYKDDDM